MIHHLTTHDSPYSEPGHKPAKPRHVAKSASSRSSGRRRRGPAKSAATSAPKPRKPAKPHRPHKGRSELTSHPTTRNAFVATREWLLELHGPVCAYCGTKHSARTMTLDHVAPRRGQTAYDRRDNLVLACQSCNQKKRDLAPLAFLLGLKSRAANLLKYGAHLSAGLIDLARSLVPEHQRHDDDSPYRD
jgi:5-methylcytosine-specific restriction endonuclease McrA